jgi:hypothetical protein
MSAKCVWIATEMAAARLIPSRSAAASTRASVAGSSVSDTITFFFVAFIEPPYIPLAPGSVIGYPTLPFPFPYFLADALRRLFLARTPFSPVRIELHLIRREVKRRNKLVAPNRQIVRFVLTSSRLTP